MERLRQSVLALSAALAALSGASAANAADSWYVRGAAGWGAGGGADISSDGPLGGDEEALGLLHVEPEFVRAVRAYPEIRDWMMA